MPSDPPPPPPAGTAPPPLSLRGVRKRFGAVEALAGIDLDFQRGEIHAVLGENGAGKSTLMNAIYGLIGIDAGTVLLGGRPARFRGPLDAHRAGIGMVHQEFALVEALTVRENLALALSPPGAWRLRLDRIGAAARALAGEIGLELGDLDTRVADLPVGIRQRLEIVKALAGHPRTRILILDEPTAVLTAGETGLLFQMLRRLRSSGATVLLITHKLPEALAVADRVTVMRRGRVVTTRPAAAVTERELAHAMVGTEAAASGPPRVHGAAGAAPILDLRQLTVLDARGVRRLDGVSLGVRPGETVGIAGVDGNGQWELFQMLAGVRAAQAGEIRVGGQAVRPSEPGRLIRLGVSSIPPDRQRQGLVLQMTVAENLILNRVLLDRLAAGPLLLPQASGVLAGELVRRYAIRTAGLDVPAAKLSGGNQQRLVVARALATEPAVLVAFNPTRGLDIGAAAAVYAALGEALNRGAAVLLISTDLDEIVALSDRIAVLYRGRLSRPLTPPFSLERLGAMMAGVE